MYKLVKANELDVDFDLEEGPLSTLRRRKPVDASTQETAKKNPEWFSRMSENQQEQYLKDHPNADYRVEHKNKQSKAPEDVAERVAKKLVEKEKPVSTPAQEILEDKGSPTNFRGPTSKQNSISDNPKKERRIVSMLDKLARLAKEAAKMGKAAPDYDLCQVAIPGTNLFCTGNKGIPRKEMPQLKGKPVPGSWADTHLQKDKNGEVDAEQSFKEMLKEKGIKVTNNSVPADELKATQSQMVGSKIAGMFQALKQTPNHPGITAPIFVSQDGYVVDGHHRWAAMVALDMADGLKEPVEMKVVQVDMPILDLIDLVNDYCNEIGIAQKAGKVKEAACSDCGLNLEKSMLIVESKKILAKLEAHLEQAANSFSEKQYRDVFMAIDTVVTDFLPALQVQADYEMRMSNALRRSQGRLSPSERSSLEKRLENGLKKAVPISVKMKDFKTAIRLLASSRAENMLVFLMENKAKPGFRSVKTNIEQIMTLFAIPGITPSSLGSDLFKLRKHLEDLER